MGKILIGVSFVVMVWVCGCMMFAAGDLDGHKAAVAHCQSLAMSLSGDPMGNLGVWAQSGCFEITRK